MTTIRDVAQRANVSVGTVSRVLNDHPSVNPAIRRTVLETIDALRYQPNAIARSLSTARTRTLGLLLFDLRNAEIVSAVIAGADSVAHEHGYGLLVAGEAGDAAAEAQQVRSLLQRRIDGLLCAASTLRPVAGIVEPTGIPTVAFGGQQSIGSMPAVVLSFAAATDAAIAHLAALGHARIGVVSRAHELHAGAAAGLRAPDIERALRRRGLRANRNLLVRAASVAACARLVQELLADEERPTALFVNALYLVPPTIAGIRAAGLRIPTDISVIGYGDSDWAKIVEPPLNVIATDLIAHLQAATRLLIGLVEQTDDAQSTIEHCGQYIQRGSVGLAPHSRTEGTKRRRT